MMDEFKFQDSRGKQEQETVKELIEKANAEKIVEEKDEKKIEVEEKDEEKKEDKQEEEEEKEEGKEKDGEGKEGEEEKTGDGKIQKKLEDVMDVKPKTKRSKANIDFKLIDSI